MPKVAKLINGIQRLVDIPDTQTIRLNGGNGHGTTNTKIRRFNSVTENSGASLITYNDSTADGATFTLVEDCQVFIVYSDCFDAAASFGISVNSTQNTTNVDAMNATTRRSIAQTTTSDFVNNLNFVGQLSAGDVIRAHTNGDGNSSSNNSLVHFELYAIKL